MWQNILNSLFNFFSNFNDFYNWLVTPFEAGGMTWYPLELFGIGTFTIIIVFWIVHLVIPL